MQIISVAGKKNTGKTSLTMKIIKSLTKRGYKVASIKHTHHNMELDKEGTDTWKHKEAGSQLVVGVGSTTFFNVKQNMELERILFLIKTIADVDFVVIEGFKKYNYPKIATSPNVVDEYTIREVDSFTITPEEIEDLTDIIEEKGCEIINTLYHNGCGYNNGDGITKDIINGKITLEDLDSIDVTLSVDGKVVGVNKFVSDFMKQTILGMLKSLNLKNFDVDEENLNNIELLIKNTAQGE